MKKYVLSGFIYLVLFAPVANSAGIVVFDAAAEVKRAAQWAKEATQWKNELKAYQDELLSKTGIRDVQSLIQDAKSISSDLTSIYNDGTAFIDDYVNNPMGLLSPKAKELLNKYNVGSTCLKQGFSGDLLKGCEARFLSDLAVIDYGDKLESRLSKENKDMDKLINQVKSATDPKSTADATNAISLAQLKFEKTKFQYEMYKDKQAALAEYKKEMVQAEYKHKQLQATIPDYKKAYSSMKFQSGE